MVFDKTDFVKRVSEDIELMLCVGICGETTTSDICLLLLHGVASSKETWHNQVEVLSKHFLLLAPDMRSHGSSSFSNDLSLDSLVGDVCHIIEELSSVIGSRHIVIIGHSVGGSVATQVAINIPSIAGVVVIDLVEETALESLQHMSAALAQWPPSFADPTDCIKWSTSMRRPQCVRSAQVSVPPLLRHNPDTSRYEWITSLTECRGAWEGWFLGFDVAFLSLSQPHCLLLASAERLDTQMRASLREGLLEMHVVHGGLGGHFVHEDSADETLGILVNFLRDHQLLSPTTANAILLSGFSTSALSAAYRSPLPDMSTFR